MRTRWVMRGLVVLVLAAAAGAVMWYAGALPASAPTAGAATAVVAVSCALLWWNWTDLPGPAAAASWYAVRRDEAVVPPAMDYRLVRLRRDLRDALSKSSDRPDRIHPLLQHLATGRLRERHAIDLAAEPERADQVMTPALSTYLAKVPTMARRSTRRDVDEALTGIEHL